MTAFEWSSTNTRTTTPFSDVLAKPLAIGQLGEPALTDLRDLDWTRPVAEQLLEISRLEEGWDGFSAGCIRQDVLEFAIDLLARIMKPFTPAPRIVPMSNEGVMLEWHQDGLDIEIEIEKPGALWVAFEDESEGDEDEGPMSSDLTTLVTYIGRLTSRAA